MSQQVLLTYKTFSEEETQALAVRLEAVLGAGDMVALVGDLGAGKSVIARAVVHARLGDLDADVPSPTFTLIQTYEASGKVPIWHADLYRLDDEEDVYELGFDEAMDTATMLVEWPDKLPAAWLGGCLIIRITIDPEVIGSRVIEFMGDDLWQVRLKDLSPKELRHE